MSALIHAATMVTVGVYLVVRSNPIFNAAPIALVAVVLVGAVTFVGAIIGSSKDDIKKVSASSTMSQIGYMVLAAGFGNGRLRACHLPVADARFLQGGHVPRRRLGDARHG